MRLSAALRVEDGEVAALVGAGGKSTAMWRLADDVVEAGGRVITTTTTQLGAAQVDRAPRHFSAFASNRAAIAAALAKHGHVLVTGPVDHTLDKAAGVSSGLIDDLCQIPELNAIVVEADGARQLPFKAPADHEPVIPPAATLVLVVAGLDALGQPLAEAHVHRPERVAALAGAAPGQVITPAMMAAVLAHAQGGLKGVPDRARVGVLLNKADLAESLEPARQIARQLLETERIEVVLIGSARRPNAVREAHGRAAAIVLAAGRSTRMGRPKQLLPWGERPIVAEVVQRLCATGVSDIVVVTGAEREAVEAALSAAAQTDRRVRCVFNPEYAEGEMARSLQAGLAALPPNCRAALAVLGDQPQLEPASVEAVVARWRETLSPVVAPFHRGRRGHPLLFDRAAWPGLQRLPAGANPRDYVRTVERLEAVEVESDSILQDIDTPDDYARGRLV